MFRTFALALLASCAITTAAAAQGSGQASPPARSEARPEQTPSRPEGPKAQAAAAPSSADRTFVIAAAESGAKEVAMGKLAVGQASQESVKAFAQHMVKDHTRVNGELQTLATARQIELTGANDSARDEVAAKFGTQPGTGFDRAYLDEMVKDHQTTVALFEQQSRDGEDAPLKAWAGKQLPVLREHLKMAQQLQAKVSGTSSPR